MAAIVTSSDKRNYRNMSLLEFRRLHTFHLVLFVSQGSAGIWSYIVPGPLDVGEKKKRRNLSYLLEKKIKQEKSVTSTCLFCVFLKIL